MDLESLTGMPDWDDKRLRLPGREGDEWKHALKNERAAKLYDQWRQVLVLLLGLYDHMNHPTQEEGDEEFIAEQKNMILGDAYLVGAKIMGAEAGDSYVLRMENASIIRSAAQTVYMHMSSLRFQGLVEEPYTDAVRHEIEKFQTLFKEWVGAFEKDEFEDEWGLY